MDAERVCDVAISAAKKVGVDDAVALAVGDTERMLRFANNSVTVANQIEETELMVYLAKNRRRAIATTSNLEGSNVRKFVGDLFASLKGLPETDYEPLPSKSRKFRTPSGRYDKKIAEVEEKLPV